MVLARIRVDGRLAAVAGAFGGVDGGLQWLWRARWRDRPLDLTLPDPLHRDCPSAIRLLRVDSDTWSSRQASDSLTPL